MRHHSIACANVMKFANSLTGVVPLLSTPSAAPGKINNILIILRISIIYHFHLITSINIQQIFYM